MDSNTTRCGASKAKKIRPASVWPVSPAAAATWVMRTRQLRWWVDAWGLPSRCIADCPPSTWSGCPAQPAIRDRVRASRRCAFKPPWLTDSGLPTHELTAETEPGVVAPVMLQTEEKLYPHRMVWPAFWGEMKESTIQPLNPEKVNEALRSTLRVKRNSTFTETLAKVTLKAEDKVAALGEERAKVAVAELTDPKRRRNSTTWKSPRPWTRFARNSAER